MSFDYFMFFLPKLIGFMYVWVDVVCGKLNYRQCKTTHSLCVHVLQEDREAKQASIAHKILHVFVDIVSFVGLLD